MDDRGHLVAGLFLGALIAGLIMWAGVTAYYQDEIAALRKKQAVCPMCHGRGVVALPEVKK